MGGNVKKILIVEDDRLSAEYLKELLEEARYEVVGITSSAEESITQSKLLNPDLILMDIMLSEQLTGCEAAVEIKQKQKQVKVVFLTAHAEVEMVDYAQQCKANAYLLKPYRDEEILATLAVIFSQDEKIVSKTDEEVKLTNGFCFNFKRQQLTQNNRQIPLNTQKIKLIELLSKNIDTTVSNEQISHTVWGESKSDSTIRSLIHRTKEVLGYELIKNANGVGYTIRSI